jgi:MATE family multidrug resistance protein
MGSVGVLFILFPHWIVPLFTADPQVQSLSIIGIRIIGILQFFDAVGMTLWFALSGAGNTIYPAVVESVLIWVFMLPASYYFGVVLGFGFYAPWVSIFFMIVSFAVLMAIKIKKGDWKKIEV